MKHLPLAAVLLSLAWGCSQASTRFGPNSEPPAAKVGPQPAQQSTGELAHRKIIYNATIELLVERLPDAAASLDNLLTQHHGLLAESELNSAPKSGSWRVRIPVDQFSDFVHQVTKLGEPLKDKTESEDVTDKYFDFQVRIENKKIQVERLQKIIKEQTGKITELLEAERELSRVTTELEQLKGTVKLWDNQVALATVNIVMRERRRDVVAESPPFARNVSSTFHSSVENLIAFVQTVALVAVALAPWAPLIALFAGAVWLIARRMMPRTTGPGDSAKTVRPA
jgi:hypothetical protein